MSTKEEDSLHARVVERLRKVGVNVTKEDVGAMDERLGEALYGKTERLFNPCPSYPEGGLVAKGSHECMAGELRCVYCAAPLAPYGCNGCGRYLSCEELNAGETRCVDCR